MLGSSLLLALTLTLHQAVFPVARAEPPAESGGLPATWCDYDGDGRPDVLAIGSESTALLRNLGYGQFEDVTELVGLPGGMLPTLALWRDYDGDDAPDLLLSGVAIGTRLFRQESGSFLEVTDLVRLDRDLAADSATWMDVDGDGRLDLRLSTSCGECIYYQAADQTFTRFDLSKATVTPQAAPEIGLGSTTAPAADPDATNGASSTVAPRDPGGAETGAPGGSSSVLTPNATTGPETASSSCPPGVLDAATGACVAASTIPTLGLLYPMSESLNVDPVTGYVGINKVDPDTPLHVVGNSRVVSNANMGGIGQGAFQIANVAFSRALSFSAEGLQSVGADLLVNPSNQHATVVNGALRVETSGRVGINKVPDAAIDLDVNGIVRAGDTIVSTKPAGAPFQIASTDLVANLNADQLDGVEASAFSQFGVEVDEAELADGAVTDAKVAAGAAIAGTKIAPDFGSQDVRTNGHVGIGIAPQVPLQVTGGTEVLVSSGGSLVVGSTFASNLAFDSNEIQSRTSLFGQPMSGQLQLNPEGGDVRLSTAAHTVEVPGKLESSRFAMTDGATAGHVLTSDSAGNAFWAPVGASADADWQVDGDDLYAGTPGRVGVGISTGAAGKLHVDGTGEANSGLFTGAAVGVTSVAASIGVQASASDPNGAGVYASGDVGVIAVGNSASLSAVEARNFGAGPILEGFNDGGTSPVFSIENDGRTVCAEVEATGDLLGDRVGIKTLQPSADLDVRGDVQISPGPITFAPAPGGLFNKIVMGWFGDSARLELLNDVESLEIWGFGLNPIVEVRNEFFPDILLNTDVIVSGGDLTLEIGADAFKPGGGLWGATSDARLKKNVKDLEGALETLMRLRGVTFEFIDPEAIGELSGERIGFIAQEVEEILPDWVDESADGYKRLTIRGFTALAVEALRDLRAEKDGEIADLRAQLRATRAALASHEKQLKDVRSDVAALRAELGPLLASESAVQPSVSGAR